MSDLANHIRTLKEMPGTCPAASELLERAAAAAPVGPVPMADPDAYALAASQRWQTVGWRCTCGATPDPADDRWRWNGIGWEHHHGYPIGHVEAQRVADPRFEQFGRAVWSMITKIGGDFCGNEWSEDVLPLAEKAGLCRRVIFDPAVHGEDIEADPGCEIWWWGESENECQQ